MKTSIQHQIPNFAAPRASLLLNLGRALPRTFHSAGAAAQRPSSPAAGSEVRNERSCRRSGAAPCSVAVNGIADVIVRNAESFQTVGIHQRPILAATCAG